MSVTVASRRNRAVPSRAVETHPWIVGRIDGFEFAGVVHLLYFGVLLPTLVVRAALRAKPGDPPLKDRAAHFRTTAFVSAMLGLVSMMTAHVLGLTMFPALRPPLVALPAALALYAVAVAYMRPRWRRAVRERPERVQRVLAVTPAERCWWIAVAVFAGVFEEVTWRGVQPVLLAHLFSSELAAVLVSAILFAVAHAVQGWRSCALIVVLALGFHLLVRLTGSLYAAMAVHVVYDVTAGFTMGRFAREQGRPTPGAARALDNV